MRKFTKTRKEKVSIKEELEFKDESITIINLIEMSKNETEENLTDINNDDTPSLNTRKWTQIMTHRPASLTRRIAKRNKKRRRRRTNVLNAPNIRNNLLSHRSKRTLNSRKRD